MIIVKSLTEKEALTVLIHAMADALPDEFKALKNAHFSASFNDDNSVDIYLVIKEANEKIN